AGHGAGDALSAAAELHRAGLRARAGRRADREIGRQGPGAGTGADRICRAGGAGRGMTGTVATPWLAELREKASERFEKLGFPTAPDEHWRFPNAAPIARTPWSEPQPDWGTGIEPRAVSGKWITFVNGRYAPHLSSDLPAGVELLDAAHPGVQQHLGRY